MTDKEDYHNVTEAMSPKFDLKEEWKLQKTDLEIAALNVHHQLNAA